MNWKIPLFKTFWDESDVEAVAKVIRRGTYWACGPEIEKFESKLAKYVGRKYAVVFNSGTSALHSCLLANNISGGEVIVPSFTFIATANAVTLAGGTPIFADIEDQTYGLNVEDVSKRISKKTRAILPIHYGGGPCRDILALKELADKKGILLIEDAAESFGAKVQGQNVGTLSSSAMFSLCQNKIISTGEGGFIVTDSEKEYNKLLALRSHGRVEAGKDYFSTTDEMDYVQVGYNYRMSTMLAALGISQLLKIQRNIDRRREHARYMDEKLKEIEYLKTPQVPGEHYHVYQMYTIQLKDQKSRDGLQHHLTKEGIMSRVYFDPIHLKKLYAGKSGRLPVTEETSKKVLTLPLYPTMSKEEKDTIIGSIASFFRK